MGMKKLYGNMFGSKDERRSKDKYIGNSWIFLIPDTSQLAAG
jgi:hypothetical protein